MASIKVPSDLRYTRTDEWIRLEGSEAVVGVTDYAQDALSDIVYVEFPQVGDALKSGERFGTVESVKAASDMHMPIGGTVTAINSALEDSTETVNKDPYGGGWFIRLKPADVTEFEKLMSPMDYEKYCADR